MLVVHNIGCLVTCEPQSRDPLGIVRNAAVVAVDDLVCWYGPERDLPPVPVGTRMLDARRRAVIPGMVDCHTHLVHVGDRTQEFASRARGRTYLEIAAAGGGILTTVRAVREATEEALVEASLPRLKRALRRGITTIEIKSGYGLDLASEIRMLRAIKVLGALQPIEIVPTLLGAHTFPEEYRSDPQGYVQLVIQEMIPAAVDAGLVQFCDVYVEEGAFDVVQARAILEAALDAGLQVKLHTDQFSARGGCELAAALQAVSADHLEQITEEGMDALRRARVVPVVLPLCEIYLGRGGPAPARALADKGLTVAVASDFNPGSANCEELCLAATLAVTRGGLTAEEAILGITRHAAAALGRDDLGCIHIGTQCDLAFLDTPDPLRLISDMAANHVERVVKAGQLVYER